MIPIYFPDSRKVSQVFISDIANKPPNLSALEFINRGEPSVNCSSDIPYIAIVVDFGGEKSNFRTRWYQYRDNDGPSLRIYASGIDQDTFPFLETHDIVGKFRDLASPPADDESLSVLINQVKFGSTSEDSHMCWELRGEHTKEELERKVKGSDNEHDAMRESSTEDPDTLWRQGKRKRK